MAVDELDPRPRKEEEVASTAELRPSVNPKINTRRSHVDRQCLEKASVGMMMK